MDELVLGIDIGTSRTKVAAYGRDGRAVTFRASPTPIGNIAGAVDFPVLAMLDTVESLIEGMGLRGSPIVGVGIGTMGEVGTILAGSRLQHIDFPAWYDDRGADVVRALEEAFGRSWLAGRTGGHVRSTSSLAKLAWLSAHGRLVDGTFLGLAGAVAWRLTGQAVQEASLASTSGAFDPVEGQYVEAIWVSAGLGGVRPARVTPPATGTPADTALARRLGLRPGAMVVIAGHDHPVAAVGTGARAGEVVDSMGTGEPVLAAVTRSTPRPSHAEVARLVADGLTVESWPSTGDVALIWEGLRPGLAMQTFLDATRGDRAALDAQAPPPGTAGLPAPDAVRTLEQGGACHLPEGPSSWAQILDHYAVMAAKGEQAVRAATGASGVTLLTGGGLRSPRWVAAKAALGATSPVVSQATETVARGAAAIAGMACGWWSDTADMPGARRLTTDTSGNGYTETG
ncbi:FGGY family carbohydrate kinase [Cellulomonas sp. KRMCY2]|uniref:FGGY family carbohydrate kinase n=1 Tax=Cellulomonas sp. KRMCY2 TaxID=1304865 RepID=UPI00045E8491|nr:FGGY family carbohydrate kinase [Cellulomonas sp. KRMCY2]